MAKRTEEVLDMTLDDVIVNLRKTGWNRLDSTSKSKAGKDATFDSVAVSKMADNGTMGTDRKLDMSLEEMITQGDYWTGQHAECEGSWDTYSKWSIGGGGGSDWGGGHTWKEKNANAWQVKKPVWADQNLGWRSIGYGGGGWRKSSWDAGGGAGGSWKGENRSGFSSARWEELPPKSDPWSSEGGGRRQREPDADSRAGSSSKRHRSADVEQAPIVPLRSGAASRGASKRVKVTNIPADLDWRDIKEAFEAETGEILRCEMKDGVAWIDYKRSQDAQKAVETFDLGELNNRTIGVCLVD